MHHLKISLGFFSLLCAVTCVATPTTPLEAFGKSGEDSDAHFCATTGKARIEADAEGRLRVNGRVVGRLPLWRNDTLDWLWMAPVQRDTLLAFEATNRGEDASGAAVCRLSSDLTKRKWCTQFPGFNLVAAMSSEGTLLLAGIGAIAEVNVETGKYLWKLSGLYKTSHAFNDFLTPVEDGGGIEFFASSGSRDSGVWVARVNRRTGQLVKAAQTRTMNPDASDFVRMNGECRP